MSDKYCSVCIDFGCKLRSYDIKNMKCRATPTTEVDVDAVLVKYCDYICKEEDLLACEVCRNSNPCGGYRAIRNSYFIRTELTAAIAAAKAESAEKIHNMENYIIILGEQISSDDYRLKESAQEIAKLKQNSQIAQLTAEVDMLKEKLNSMIIVNGRALACSVDVAKAHAQLNKALELACIKYERKGYCKKRLTASQLVEYFMEKAVQGCT